MFYGLFFVSSTVYGVSGLHSVQLITVPTFSNNLVSADCAFPPKSSFVGFSDLYVARVRAFRRRMRPDALLSTLYILMFNPFLIFHEMQRHRVLPFRPTELLSNHGYSNDGHSYHVFQ